MVWLDRPVSEESARPDTLRVAPLQVGGLLAERLFKPRTVVLTSATLTLGGSFEPLARQWGLPQLGVSDRVAQPAVQPEKCRAAVTRLQPPRPGRPPLTEAAVTAGRPRRPGPDGGGSGLDWTGLDVGSPFDHRRSGDSLRRPASAAAWPRRTVGRLPDRAARADRGLWRADTRAVLLDARRPAGGRCAARRRSASRCSARARTRPGCWSASSPRTRRAACSAHLSLWQGVDVPGRSLQLVVIDRIPFPRPDDPLASARQRAVAARGGNGFMAVAASQAALLLAQGTGRLLRTIDDRGRDRDPGPAAGDRRYGSFLRASLPPYWSTYDPQIVAQRPAAAGCRACAGRGFRRLSLNSGTPANGRCRGGAASGRAADGQGFATPQWWPWGVSTGADTARHGEIRGPGPD